MLIAVPWCMGLSIAVPVGARSARSAEQTTFADWLCRIRAEYIEVPGLSLTRAQAKRLWGLDDATCDRLLASLVNARFLRLSASGTYVRAD
jgi:hypothetical protein